MSSAGKSKSIVWSEECASAFRAAKDDLAQAVLLHHPNPFSSTSLTVHVSDYAAGAELSQKSPEGSLRPIAFFSTPAERKYSAFDRELLAIFVAVKHFRHYLEGRAFTIFTDHKPLIYAFSSDMA